MSQSSNLSRGEPTKPSSQLPLKAKFPVDASLASISKKKKIKGNAATKPTGWTERYQHHATGSSSTISGATTSRPQTAESLRKRVEQLSGPSAIPNATTYYALDSVILDRKRDLDALNEVDTAYRHLIDPNLTRAGERAAYTVSLLIPENRLRPTSGYGRVKLKTTHLSRPQTARVHSSQDYGRQLTTQQPMIKQFLPETFEAKEGLNASPSAKALLELSASTTNAHKSVSPPTRKHAAPWYTLHHFTTEPTFQFVNLQATTNIIGSGALANNSNIQLCFILSTRGFSQMKLHGLPDEEIDDNENLDGGDETIDQPGDAEEAMISYQNTSGQTVRFKKAPSPHRRRKKAAPTNEDPPSFTLTFQTHLPALFSLVDDAHYTLDSSDVCPSKLGMIHTLALQYSKLIGGKAQSRVKVGDIRLIRFALESMIYSLEHTEEYFEFMDWTLHYIAITMKGPQMVFIGSYQDVHIIVATSAKLGDEIDSTTTRNQLPLPTAWFMQKNKLYIIHLPLDVAFSGLQAAVRRLHPLPPTLGENIDEMLQKWNSSRSSSSKPNPLAHSTTSSSRPSTLPPQVQSRPASRNEANPLREDEQISSMAPANRLPSSLGTRPSEIATSSTRPTAFSAATSSTSPLLPSSSPLSMGTAALAESFVHEDVDDEENEWDTSSNFEDPNFKPAIRAGTASIRRPQTAHTPTVPAAASSATPANNTTMTNPSNPSPWETESLQPSSSASYFGLVTPEVAVQTTELQFVRPHTATARLQSPTRGVSASSTRPTSSDGRHTLRSTSPSRPPRTQMRTVGAAASTADDVEIPYPGMGGVTHTITYVSENLAQNSYFEQRPPLVKFIETPTPTEEKESSSATLAGPVRVRVGNAALRPSTVPNTKVRSPKTSPRPPQPPRRPSPLTSTATATASSGSLSARGKKAKVTNEPTSSTGVNNPAGPSVTSTPASQPQPRPPSPVLTFFGDMDVASHVMKASQAAVKTEPIQIPALLPNTIRLGTRTENETKDGGLDMDAPSTSNTKHSRPQSAHPSRAPHPVSLESKEESPLDDSKSVMNQTGSFPVHSISSTASTPTNANGPEASQASRTLAFDLSHPHPSQISSRSALTTPREPDSGTLTHDHQEEASTTNVPSPRPHSAFVRRASGGAVVISGKQVTGRRPESAKPQTASPTTAPQSETTNSANSSRPDTARTDKSEMKEDELFSVPLKEGGVMGDREDNPTTDETDPQASVSPPPMVNIPASSDIPTFDTSLFDFSATQTDPLVATMPDPLSFQSFIGSTDHRTNLPQSAAVVTIPAGHPLSFNRPMSELELQQEGVDLFNTVCGLDTCENKLYAVSGLGYQLYKCVWCRSIIYCSSNCMVEDWMKGRHPPICHAVRLKREHEEGVSNTTAAAFPASPRASGPTSPSNRQTRSRSRSPLRIPPDEPPFMVQSSMMDPPLLGTGGYDAYDIDSYPSNSYDEPYLDSSMPSSQRQELLHRSQRAAEEAEVLAQPHSLSSAMVELSSFPAQPAFRLATRMKSRPTSAVAKTKTPVTTVADVMTTQETSYTPAMVLPTPRISENHQLETQRAYAILYDELRASAAAHQPWENVTTRRPASAKIAPPPAAATAISSQHQEPTQAIPHAHPQDPSHFLSRLQARMSPGVNSGIPSAPNHQNRQPPLVPRVRVGGGGSLTSHAVEPSISLLIEPSNLTYTPLASTTQLYAKTRGKVGLTRPHSATTTRSSTSSSKPSYSSMNVFSKGLTSPKLFPPSAPQPIDLEQFLRRTNNGHANPRASSPPIVRGQSTNRASLTQPSPPVIPQVDLKRALAASRPTSARDVRLASNGRAGMQL